MTKPSPALSELFSKNVNITRFCWEWTGAKNSGKYGLFRGRLAHRLAWQMQFGKIPDGLNVLHHCNNPPCVNPNHLFLGTNYDNSADMCAKGRQAKGAYLSGIKLAQARAKEAEDRAAVVAQYAARGGKVCILRYSEYLHERHHPNHRRNCKHHWHMPWKFAAKLVVSGEADVYPELRRAIVLRATKSTIWLHTTKGASASSPTPKQPTSSKESSLTAPNIATSTANRHMS